MEHDSLRTGMPSKRMGVVPAGWRVAPRWRIAGYLGVAAFLNYADRAAFSAVLPPLKSDLGLSDTAIGLAGSAFLWCYAAFSPFAGSVADRFSRSRIVFFSLLLWSAVMLFTGFAQGLVVLLILRALLGIVESFYHPAAFALIADHHDSTTRGKAMSILGVGFHCGVIGGGAVAGYLAEAFNWRVGFWILGLVGILFAMLSSTFLSDAPRNAAEAKTRGSFAASLRYLVKVPSYHIMLAKSMFMGITTWMLFAWLPLYYLETFDLNLGAAGLIGMFMLQFPKILGLGLGGWISDRVARKNLRERMWVLAVTYFVATPFLIPFFTHPFLWVVSLSLGVFSLISGIGLANEQPILSEVVPNAYRSTAIGITNTCATAAGGVGVLLAGILKESQVNLGTIFASASLGFCLSGVLLLIGYLFFMARDVARCREQDELLG